MQTAAKLRTFTFRVLGVPARARAEYGCWVATQGPVQPGYRTITIRAADAVEAQQIAHAMYAA